MRRSASVLAALVALTALSGCGGNGKNDTGNAGRAPGPEALKDAKGPVTVTLWHGLGDTNAVALQKLVDRFNDQHRGKIKVKAVYQGQYPDVLAKYTAAIRDKSTPSLLLSYDISTGFLHDAGQTVPAQDLAEANPGTLSLDDIRPAARNYYSAQGKLMAVPFNTSMPMLYVNDDLLKKAGLPANTPLNTLDQVVAAAKTVHREVPRVGGLVQPFDTWWIEQLTAAAGVPYCGPDNGRKGSTASSVKLTSPQQRKAIGAVSDLYTSGAGLDTGEDGSNAVTAFQQGKVAMMFNSSGAAGKVKEGADFRYRALPYPLSGPAATSGSVVGGAAMWVNGPGHSAAEQAASWQVAAFLASPASQEEFSRATGYAPINKKVDALPEQKKTLAARPDLKAVIDQFNRTPATTATAGCLTGAMPTVRADVLSPIQSAFAGKTPLDAALKNAESAANRDIERYREQAGQ
ncbi:ABC transporter substrate-binding protein [Streptomyces sp. NEAU-YJ-81]|uniref:ABC transporter substrate-binding protein n=1 Tax=Streptomyces sp. NEAU-YJ-81 TaxID=2820288 RepID=UPI001ABD2EAB|nr:ABC transporter substrate-binding protein [Streptomyces sp. NEAU-YJ-81]MBO3674696.1 ABC transporter substrate-binding protein [Streptomyces sp. NEAU-YJ-81]